MKEQRFLPLGSQGFEAELLKFLAILQRHPNRAGDGLPNKDDRPLFGVQIPVARLWHLVAAVNRPGFAGGSNS
jgi:hypothetical protein